MNVGFFTVFRTDPCHFLHAAALVREAHQWPGAWVTQLTDQTTDAVPGIDRIRRYPNGVLLERRLEHYATCGADVHGDWLLVDTDVAIREDVRAVFDDRVFDVAFADRNWPHLPQDEPMLQTMPVNSGVCFSRAPAFWVAVLETWRGFTADERKDWYSEQRAVYAVIRSGRFRVKLLPGMVYNYPPATADDPGTGAALVHYKGPRKVWRSAQAYQLLGAAREVTACV